DAPETRMDIVFATTGARATAPRVVLDVGPGSKLKVLETHLSLSESDEALSNGLCRVVAGEGAEVRHEVIQQKADGARWVQSVMAEVAEGASYSLRSVQSGSRAARLNAAVALAGEKSFGELTGVMLADTKQQLDLHSLIHHSVPFCRSKQQHKNLVGGSAECIFKGTIRVDAEAQQTESSQLVRSLLLTKKSKVKAMPSLQIQADDVTCSHGAALTQLDKDELFYLASRGLDGRDAR
ncbi:ABCI7, partial [Symbiodinium sp. CCMP2456]